MNSRQSNAVSGLLSSFHLLIILAWLLPVTCFAENLGTRFVTAKLAHGASISIPSTWKVFRGNELSAIETATSAVIDLSGYAKVLDGAEALIVSRFPDGALYAALMVTATRAPGLGPAFPDSLSDSEMRLAEAYIRKGTEAGQRLTGWEVLGWTPLRKVVLNGKPVLHISYLRSSDNGETRVHVFKVFGVGRAYELALSTRVAAESVNRVVLDKIASSFVSP